MPSITLVTNVKLDEEETRSFIMEFSKVFVPSCAYRGGAPTPAFAHGKFSSVTIGKPEDQFCIDFNYNPYLAIRGTLEPAVRMHVVSLWNTTPENAQKWAEAFFKFFEARLGVPTNRGHFAFTDPGDQFIGVGGSTMAALKARR